MTLWTDEASVAALKRRLTRGIAGAAKVLLYHYAYGKPEDTVAFQAGSRPIIFEVLIPRPPAEPTL